MINIETQITGNLVAQLNEAVRQLTAYRPLLESFGKRAVTSMRRNIMEQRSPAGERYAPLKKPRGKGHNPGSIALFDSGHLYGAGDNLGDGLQYRLLMPDAVVIGENTAYGKYHNEGTGRIPARPFIGLRAEDADQFRIDLAEFVASAFGDHK